MTDIAARYKTTRLEGRPRMLQAFTDWGKTWRAFEQDRGPWDTRRERLRLLTQAQADGYDGLYRCIFWFDKRPLVPDPLKRVRHIGPYAAYVNLKMEAIDKTEDGLSYYLASCQKSKIELTHDHSMMMASWYSRLARQHAGLTRLLHYEIEP